MPKQKRKRPINCVCGRIPAIHRYQGLNFYYVFCKGCGRSSSRNSRARDARMEWDIMIEGYRWAKLMLKKVKSQPANEGKVIFGQKIQRKKNA